MLASMGVTMGPQSEDCLYLNIWTKPQTGEKKKAVMVRTLTRTRSA
jgi:carboxylesterase type B